MFYRKLQNIMDSRGLSVADVAKLSNLHDSTVRSIITRKSKTAALEVAFKIARGLNVSLEYLNGIDNSEEINRGIKLHPAQSLTPSGRRIGKAYEKATPPVQKTVEVALEPWIDEKPPAPAPAAIYRIAQPIPDEVEYTELPEYDEPAAAGFGNYLEGSRFEMRQFVTSRIPRGTDICVRISGDSMEPDYPNGCIVFVETRPIVENGQVGIFVLGGSSLCKRLAVDHAKREARLESLNPKYEPVIIKDDMELRTVGRVLGIAEEE